MAEDEKKISVDTGLKVALRSIGVDEVRDEVSKEEYDELSSKVSQGVRLRLEAKAKEQNRVMMWKSRVNLVKHARALMLNKQFSEAAVAYEKYIRVLEVIYDLKSGQLNPDLFNKSVRSKELTVITSVYWDLLRIYDTSPAYKERMAKSATKLIEFLPYSKIFPHVAKSLDSFQRSAKNPKIIKHMIKELKLKKGACFIASAVYEDTWHPDVETFREFRDTYLKTNFWGRKFVYFYYKYSPSVVRWDSKLNLLKMLKPLLFLFAISLRRLKK